MDVADIPELRHVEKVWNDLKKVSHTEKISNGHLDRMRSVVICLEDFVSQCDDSRNDLKVAVSRLLASARLMREDFQSRQTRQQRREEEADEAAAIKPEAESSVAVSVSNEKEGRSDVEEDDAADVVEVEAEQLKGDEGAQHKQTKNESAKDEADKREVFARSSAEKEHKPLQLSITITKATPSPASNADTARLLSEDKPKPISPMPSVSSAETEAEKEPASAASCSSPVSPSPSSPAPQSAEALAQSMSAMSLSSSNQVEVQEDVKVDVEVKATETDLLDTKTSTANIEAAEPEPEAEVEVKNADPEPEAEVKNAVRRIPSIELDYVKIRQLHSTLCGSLYLYQHRTTKQLVAVKESIKRAARNMLESPEFELQVLRRINSNGGHPNVLQLVGEGENDTHMWLVLEFCTKGELFKCMQQCANLRTQLPLTQARIWCRGITSGLAHMHDSGFCHLDLSTENVIITGSDEVKLIDFGMAQGYDVKQPQLIAGNRFRTPGKTGYRAPEVHKGQSYDGGLADSWSLGIVLFIMLAGVPPLEIPDESDARFRYIMAGRLAHIVGTWGLSHRFSTNAIDFLGRLLCPAGKRMRIHQALEHPFLSVSK